VVIKEESKPQQPGRPQSLVIRQDEPQWPDDMRRHPPEYLTFCEGLAHEAEFQMLEVAQTAVDQLGGGRRGAARQIGLLTEING
jgi:hypothetical protein